MAQLRIDQLNLRVAGLSADEGERLVDLVLRRLSGATLPSTLPARFEALTAHLPLTASNDLESLSARISAQLIAEMTRSL